LSAAFERRFVDESRARRPRRMYLMVSVMSLHPTGGTVDPEHRLPGIVRGSQGCVRSWPSPKPPAALPRGEQRVERVDHPVELLQSRAQSADQRANRGTGCRCWQELVRDEDVQLQAGRVPVEHADAPRPIDQYVSNAPLSSVDRAVGTGGCVCSWRASAHPRRAVARRHRNGSCTPTP